MRHKTPLFNEKSESFAGAHIIHPIIILMVVDFFILKVIFQIRFLRLDQCAYGGRGGQ
jgi:hypothetical protein